MGLILFPFLGNQGNCVLVYMFVILISALTAAAKQRSLCTNYYGDRHSNLYTITI